MRKYNVVEYSFIFNNTAGIAVPPRVVASGLTAEKAQARVRTLNDERAGGDGIARAYRAEAAAA